MPRHAQVQYLCALVKKTLFVLPCDAQQHLTLKTHLTPSHEPRVTDSKFLRVALLAVPLALFSNGIFLHGKRFWEGNVKKVSLEYMSVSFHSLLQIHHDD